MLILYSSDLFGDTKKYFRLLTLTYHLKPTYTILNGNIFVTKDGILGDIDEIIKIIKSMTVNTKVLIQLAGYDNKQSNEKITNLFSIPQIKDITNKVIKEPELNFAGINYVPSHLGGYWTMTDGCINKESKDNNSEILIRQQLEICNPLNTVYVSFFPPLGILDYDPDPLLKGCYNIRKLCEGEFSNKQQPILLLCGAFVRNYQYSKEWFKKVGNCLCIQPSQEESGLYFSLIEIEPTLEITYFYHPNEYINKIKEQLHYERIE